MPAAGITGAGLSAIVIEAGRREAAKREERLAVELPRARGNCAQPIACLLTPPLAPDVSFAGRLRFVCCFVCCLQKHIKYGHKLGWLEPEAGPSLLWLLSFAAAKQETVTFYRAFNRVFLMLFSVYCVSLLRVPIPEKRDYACMPCVLS